jgi:hypothetical protein
VMSFIIASVSETIHHQLNGLVAQLVEQLTLNQ